MDNVSHVMLERGPNCDTVSAAAL